MSKPFYTYKTIPEEPIQVQWLIYGTKVPKDGIIKQWKKNADLELTLELYLNNTAIKECIEKDVKVAIYIFWHSLNNMGGTSLHDIAYKTPYDKTTKNLTDDFEISNIFIPGEKIAGSIEISIAFAIEKSKVHHTKSIYATELGSILFEQSIILHLEGNQALFPVKAVDFHNIEGMASGALYYLQKKYADLGSNFNASYKLYFNTSHPLFKKINSENENDMTTSYLLKMIMYDIYKNIVVDALDSENGLIEIKMNNQDLFTLEAVYSRIISDVLSLYFPEKNLDDLKQLLKTDERSRNSLFTAVQDYILGE